MLLGYIIHTLGVVTHVVRIVKIFNMGQGELSHLPHNTE